MDLKMCEAPTAIGFKQSEKYRRLKDSSQMIFGDRCGNGMTVIHAVCIAHTDIYNALINADHHEAANRVKHAFDYICTAFECQNEGVYDWNRGRELVPSLMYYGFALTSDEVASYILVSILVELEAFNYGNVGRAALAYIIDLFALYFLTREDWHDYIEHHCDFPAEWVERSVVVSALKQYCVDDIFGHIPDTINEYEPDGTMGISEGD